MAANEIHKDDIGTIFEVTVKDGSIAVDVSGATTKDIIFKKPNGSTLTKASVFVSDGTNGKIKYTSIAGDLDVIGVWKIQSHLVLSGGTWKTDVGSFEVFDNL